MESSSSSKVTVEYHDPSGVFPLISHDLANRLPLRNLNWQSQARSLRQIKHLHVDLVADRETQAALNPPARSESQRRKTSLDIIRNASETPKPDGKDRRHQIPGLKTTPYLKLYILRCDDKDWYKQEERAKLREWLRTIIPADGKQEQHEAFEWLIIHVIIPDTVAASEPRWRESSKDPDELKERGKNSNAKWPGKPGKTVFDRLRNDFNDSKTPDRVAQIRLPKASVSVDLLPVPALAKTLEETPDEREKSWNDLMAKIRFSILHSFDARVQQYEFDIAEQENRRTLPGWNFNTFFIHKEGLARALESVGLVEDALAIYDELSLGLETALIDLASGQASSTATTFSPAGTDIVERLTTSKQGLTTIRSASSDRIFEKDYRAEIVRSSISVFDFFCYLFERQTALILRLAGKAARTESGLRDGEDLVMLAEVCWRGLSFIHNGARTLKQDLVNSSMQLTLQDVQSLVCSWTFSAADFVLSRTQSSHLDISDASIRSPTTPGSAVPPSPRRDFGFSMGADPYPQRSSSLLSPSTTTIPEIKSPTALSSTSKISEDGFSGSGDGHDAIKAAGVPGLAELAAYRAELVSLKRKMLEMLAQSRGWSAGWASLNNASFMDDVNIDDNKQSGKASTMLGPDLAVMLRDQRVFEKGFEVLTDTAARHYLCATHIKFAERLMGDLAILKFSQNDFLGAIAYFEHVLPIFSSDGWTDLEIRATTLQSTAYKKLGRHEEAIKTSLALLASEATRQLASRSKSELDVTTPRWQDIDKEAKLLSRPFTTSITEYFADVKLQAAIQHSQADDSFSCQLHLQHLLNQTITVDEVVVQLSSVEDETIEICLKSLSSIELQHGENLITLQGNCTTFGVFHIESIEMKAGNVRFKHDYKPRKPSIELDTAPDAAINVRPTILIWPAESAFDAVLTLSRDVTVNKAQHFSLALRSGRNEISEMEIRLKPASAGLRIHLDDCSADGVEIRPSQASQAGLVLGNMNKDSEANIMVHYSTEQAVTDIRIKLEIKYSTKDGAFRFLKNVLLPAQLPLDVEVNDRFSNDYILSRFLVKSTCNSPLFLEKVKLNGSSTYAVEASSVQASQQLVLVKQPVDFLFKISRKDVESGRAQKQSALELVVHCVSIEKLAISTMVSHLVKALKKSEFSYYRGPILSLLTQRIDKLFTAEDLEMAALLSEAKIPSFADVGWFDIIDAIPEDAQRPLTNWLMRWHIDHQHVTLNTASPNDACRRHITIMVDVPTVDYTFKATLSSPALQNPFSSIVSIGQPIEVVLTIQATRQWAAKSSSRADAEKQEFVYDVVLSNTCWVVDGQKRHRFVAPAEHAVFESQLLLIPLEAGLQPLPIVDVQPVVKEGSESVSSPRLPAVSCQTHCASAGRVVRIIAGKSTTRIVAFEAESERLDNEQ